MLRHAIHLGTSTHRNPAHDIQLQISSSVQISKDDSLDTLCKEEVSLKTLLERKIWVSWCPNAAFQLTVSIMIQDPRAIPCSISAILRLMVDLLTKSPIWPGLDFLVTSEESVSKTKQDGNTLCITLRVHSKSDQNLGTGLSRFPKPVYTLLSAGTSMNLPPALSTAHIYEIDILACFSSTASTQISRGPLYLPLYISKEEPVGNPYCEATDFTKNRHLEIDLQDFPSSEGDWESLDDLSPLSSQQSINSCSSISPPGSVSPIYQIRTSSPKLIDSIRPFLSLLTAGFNGVLSPNVSISKNIPHEPPKRGLTGLAELAPSVFRPEYHTAMHQRSCFIPLVVKGVSSMLKRSKNRTLDSALSRISGAYERCHKSTMQGAETCVPADMNNILHYLLWAKMRDSLHRTDEILRKRNPSISATVESLLSQGGKPSQRQDNTQVNDSVEVPVEVEDYPNPDWYLFEDEEGEEDMLFSEEMDCDQQEEWYDQLALERRRGTKNDDNVTSTDLLPDSDDILPSSPCFLLKEMDLGYMSPQGIRDDRDIGLELEMDIEILQSSSPLILPSPESLPVKGSDVCNIGVDRAFALVDMSSDIEMML